MHVAGLDQRGPGCREGAAGEVPCVTGKRHACASQTHLSLHGSPGRVSVRTNLRPSLRGSQRGPPGLLEQSPRDEEALWLTKAGGRRARPPGSPMALCPHCFLGINSSSTGSF